MNRNLEIAIKKKSTGNYFGWYMGYYIFIYKRPHGKWCCRIGRKGEWLFSEGYFGTYLNTLKKAKKWAMRQTTIFILSLVLIFGCNKTLHDAIFHIESKNGLYPIENCNGKDEDGDEYASGYGIDTVGVSVYCDRHYNYSDKNVYLWDCKYLSKLDETDKELRNKIGCWYYYIDGHQFSIHHHQ